MKKVFWVGARESDIINETIFCGSITLFGSGKNNNYSYANARKEHLPSDYYNFIKDTIYLVLEKNNNDCYFLFSNPKTAYLMPRDIQEKIICLNEYVKIMALNDKFFQRQYFSNICKTPPSIILSGNLVKDIKFITNIFNNEFNEFIVQKSTGGGGKTTYLLSSKTDIELLDNETYIVSPYYKNSISLNVHCLILEKDVVIFPPSFQIINDNFNYIGADFIVSQSLRDNIKQQIYKTCKEICNSMKNLNVKGLFGIDFLLNNNELIFLETNFRIQGSTFLLNYGLRDIGLSIYEILILGYYGEKYFDLTNIFNANINYSFHKLNDKNSFCPPISPFKINYDGYNSEIHKSDKYYKLNMVYKESIINFFC